MKDGPARMDKTVISRERFAAFCKAIGLRSGSLIWEADVRAALERELGFEVEMTAAERNAAFVADVRKIDLNSLLPGPSNPLVMAVLRHFPEAARRD